MRRNRSPRARFHHRTAGSEESRRCALETSHVSEASHVSQNSHGWEACLPPRRCSPSRRRDPIRSGPRICSRVAVRAAPTCSVSAAMCSRARSGGPPGRAAGPRRVPSGRGAPVRRCAARQRRPTRLPSPAPERAVGSVSGAHRPDAATHRAGAPGLWRGGATPVQRRAARPRCDRPLLARARE